MRGSRTHILLLDVFIVGVVVQVPVVPGLERVYEATARISTDHLDITTYVRDDAAAFGVVFSLVLDIEPRARVYVYAPGAAEYRAIALTVEAAPFLQLRSLKFSTPDLFYSAPLNERVPVYRKPFRVIQEVSVGFSPASAPGSQKIEKRTVRAALAYQACDDKVCFPPASVPLSWMVTLRRKDRSTCRPRAGRW